MNSLAASPKPRASHSLLPRDKSSRVILPPPALLVPGLGCPAWSDEELTAIYEETLRRRRSWSLGHYFRIAVIVGFLAWTFLLMPLAALNRWPFN